MPPERTRTLARWRARIVTVGLLVVIAVAVGGTVEAWPVTSFRLFSQVRTSKSSSYRLIAVDDGGHEHPVVVDDDHTFARRTSSQLWKLPRMSADRRRAKVLALLDASGLADADVKVVILRRQSYDGRLDTSVRHQVGSKDVLRIEVDR